MLRCTDWEVAKARILQYGTLSALVLELLSTKHQGVCVRGKTGLDVDLCALRRDKLAVSFPGRFEPVGLCYS